MATEPIDITCSQLPRPRLDDSEPSATSERRPSRRGIRRLLAGILADRTVAPARASRRSPDRRPQPRAWRDATPRIVFAYANDHAKDGKHLKHLPQECRDNKAALQDAEDGNHIKLITCPNATLDDVITQCQKYREQIVGVHFGGHSGGTLVELERDDGTSVAAAAGPFAEFLGQLPALKWAFVNGCCSHAQVEALRRRGVPVVIATSTFVRDEVAQTMAYYFYGAMARGETLDAAFRHATVDTRFRFSVDSRSPSTGLFRDIVEPDAPVPTDHLPWEIHGGDAARQYRLVPDVDADPLDEGTGSSRSSAPGQPRSVVPYQAACCLIALAITAAAVAVAATVWSVAGATRPAPPAPPKVDSEGELGEHEHRETAAPQPTPAPATSPHLTPAPAAPPQPTRGPEPRPASAQHDRPRPRTAISPLPSSRADLDKETARRRLRAHREDFKYCYEQQLLRDPTLTGTVSTRFLIAPAGAVSSLKVSGFDSDLSSCVAATIRDIEFPQSNHNVLIYYPLHFRPAGSM